LATKGASGGAVAEKMVIAPQWVPVTQLVLLTLKVWFLTFSDLTLHQSELVIQMGTPKWCFFVHSEDVPFV
jgi:hypothetical protein